MPFRLKNEGATYQRLGNRMFKSQIGSNMEVYVDDLLIKSKAPEQHLANLSEAFAVLRRYQMKLNPAKCDFNVDSEKFLGFKVSERGIQENCGNVKAIMDMSSPWNVNEV